MKVGGICPECGHYYRGEVCPREHMSTASGYTMHVINDIPEHFNRGLGAVVKSRADYKAQLKAGGFTEVGNEKKYVDPVEVRKIKDQERDKQYAAMRPEAYRILEHCEGHPRWN